LHARQFAFLGARRLGAVAVACLAAAALAASALANAAGQPPQAETADQSRRAAERLQALQQEADALMKQERTLVTELRRLQVERELQTTRLRAAEADQAAVVADLAATTRHIQLLEQERDAQIPILRSRLLELYKLGSAGYMRLLLGVRNVRDAGRAYRMVSALAALDRERVRAHQSTLASLGVARDELAAREAVVRKLRDQAAAARAAADRAMREHAALLSRIDARRDLNAQLTGELEAAQQRLQRAVDGLDDDGNTTLPLRPFQGALDWPIADGRVYRFFGAGGGPERRNGMELSASPGVPVRAIHEGTVAFAGPFTGYGNLVIVNHGGAYSIYGYLDEVSAVKGLIVARGEQLGTAGASPTGTPALYFELRVDGHAVDPLQWLKRRP
jgi:septal ring factor EnvC (AmiA/AmiB activator)